MATILNRQTTFATNGTVTAAGLHNLIDDTQVYAAIINSQTELTSAGTSDKLLISDFNLPDTSAPKYVTVHNLLDDGLSAGVYTSASFTSKVTSGSLVGPLNGNVTGNLTGNVTGNINSTYSTFGSSTTGTTYATAGSTTNGTVQTLTVSTATISEGTYSGAINSTTGTIATLRSTTGTIGNLSTTLVGDFTISTGSATVGTRVAVVNTAQEYTAAHNFNATTLTSGNSIAWDLSSNQVARLVLSTDGTMADAQNKVDGAVYILIVTQGTGSNTLAWNATYKWPGGTAPTLTTGSLKSDIFTFVSNGTSLFGVASQNYS